MTRGEANFNPGNIDRNATHWQGMCSDQSGDSRFVVFSNAEDGIRALCKVLLSYYRQHGLNTVRSIINRWAPSVENNSAAYINAVARSLTVSPDAIIDVGKPETLEMLARAIITHENGRCIYDDATIVKAVDRALA